MSNQKVPFKTQPPKCPKCWTEAVPNQVLGKDFWYCRTCKVEVFASEIVSSEPAKKRTGYVTFNISSDGFTPIRIHDGSITDPKVKMQAAAELLEMEQIYKWSDLQFFGGDDEE
jgi:hypothetical protein